MKTFFDAAFSVLSCLVLLGGLWVGRDLIRQFLATLRAFERYCDKMCQPLTTPLTFNCNFEQPRRRQKKAGEAQPPIAIETELA